jgi:type III secretion protein R
MKMINFIATTNLSSSSLIFILSIVGFISFILLFVTSFVKISIVFGLLRSALGTPQLPPTTVITGLSIILSIYVMSPVFYEIYSKSSSDVSQIINDKNDSQARLNAFGEFAKKSSDPMKKFLNKHAHEKEKVVFFQMAKKMHKDMNIKKDSFLVLVPSFLLSEITEAFQIGFLLFLPFLILDLLVANILMALGMHMLSPTTISLPFKLLLFVAVDGFTLLSQSLIMSYM